MWRLAVAAVLLAALVSVALADQKSKPKPNGYAALGMLDLSRVDPKLREAVMREMLNKMIDDDEFRREGSREAQRILGHDRWVLLQKKMVMDAYPELHRKPVLRRIIMRRIR